VKSQTRFRISAAFAVLAVSIWIGSARAQELPTPKPSGDSVPLQVEVIQSATSKCLQPPSVVSLADYDGPLKKTIGLFTRQLERKSVHPPHYMPGVALCSLGLRDKFLLFVHESYDPITFLSAGFNAGISQAQDADPSFGQGTAGYGKRFGANLADQASFRFFRDFAYPSIFFEDPRYYRLAHGSGGRRLLHAVEHVFVAYSNNGNRMFNFSEWVGTVSTASLSNVYHPGNKRGFSPAAETIGYSVINDVGFDVLREFWPEIARKFKLPFHAEPAPSSPGPFPIAN
jgi:hypothetical protein